MEEIWQDIMTEPAFVTWLLVGLFMMLAEILLPGMVSVFLGLGAVAVAFMWRGGMLETHLEAVATWVLISLVFLLFIRQFFVKLFPGETSHQNTSEDVDHFGKIVTVTEDIPPGGEGRIQYLGTSWPATCSEGTIVRGARARLVHRTNIGWMVQAVSPADIITGETEPG